MTLADLQSNISISANNAVTGDIEFCTGYTGFSDDIGEQAGWYLALKVSTSAEGSALEGATITATYAGTVRTLEDGETFIVRLAEGEDSITFTANKEGYTEGRLTLDLSGLDKEALTQNILYTASLTNGVTVSPLQFGESKTITGQVPWNTTDNANTFNISMRPFEMVAPGTPWSIAFNGVELAEGEFSLITPDNGSSYSFATAKLPVTAAMISDQSPYLVVTVRSYGPDPMGSFYSSMNIGGLTLEPGPYNPETDPFFELTGVVYNDHTYNVSDFVSGGTLTRGYSGSQNNLVLTGATIKYCGIDPDAEQNYYLAFTSRVGAEGEHQGSYYEFTELSLQNPLNNPPSPHTLPQTFLVKVNKNTGNISGTGRMETSPGTYQTKSPKIYFQNCTWETDPRPSPNIEWTMLPASAQYNGTPVSNYVVNTYQSATQWPAAQTYAYNNGYYGFLWIKNGEINATNDLSNYINYTDVTADITGVQLGTYDKVYMYDITTLNRDHADVRFFASGYKPAIKMFIQERNQILPAYANGLTPRNMTIKPLDSTAKADKFGNWCDISFSPIDPATATIVNDEITVSVSGTINTRASDDANAGSALSSDYKPMYKTKDNYSSVESGQKLWLNKNKYYFIVEIDNAFVLIDGTNPPPWQCKGFTSTQTTFTSLGSPTQLSPAKKSIWAIPIESGATSVSIKCVPRYANTYTEVTYTFDLTNVTYGTT